MMERLTKYGNTSHENGVCCTHFNSKECHEVAGNCAMGCKWEEEAWSKLAHYEDLEEQNLLIKLPCKVGDTIYQVVKGTEDGELFIFPRKLRTKTLLYLLAEKVGKTAFLTKEEAEAKLKEMQNDGTR